MTRTQTICFNLIAVTVLLIVSGVAMCFQVVHGETIEPVMGILWWAIWMLSMWVGAEVVFDAIDNERDEFEEWLRDQIPPLFPEEVDVQSVH